MPSKFHLLHRAFFLLIGSIFCQLTIAQTGDFILTHHSPKHSEIDNINFEITADKNGIICIANRFGVLKYDGNEWNFYRTNSSALSLAVSSDNVVYVGCLGGFGKLDFVSNTYGYVPIVDSDSLSDHFLQTFALDDRIYFLSDKNLYQYTPSTDEVKNLLAGDFLNGYVNDEKLHINTYDETVITVGSNQIDSLTNPDKLWGIILPSPDGISEFSVDLDGGLFVKQGDEVKPHHHYERLQEAEVAITDLEWVNDSLVACSTIESGVFFLHVSDSSYFEVTDYHSGLPDNEIHDLYADENQGVWVAHEFGLTRIAPLFPAYSYTNFPGLEGNLIEAQRLKDDLWINTSLGVYYFSKDTSYRSRVYVQQVRKEPKKARRATPKQTVQQAEESLEEKDEEPEEKKGKKRGFLSGLFKKKDRAQESNKEEEKKGFFKKIFSTNDDEKQGGGKEQEEDKYKYVRRVEKVVTGVSYQFHHVPDTDGKFRQLIETKDRILATSHTGIYEIDKNSAQLVINHPVKYAYAVPESNQLLISTERGMLKYYDLINNIWTEISSTYFEDVILNVYMDHLGEVWLAGTTHIYQGVFSEEGFLIEHSYEINNRYYDELSIWEHSGKLYFINSQGYFRLDRKLDRIVKDLELKKELGSPHHHIHNEKSRVWLYNGKIWQLLLPDGSVEEFKYLGVFPNLKYINYDEKLDRYWLITDDNQLLAYDAKQIPEFHQSYSIFVKRLVGKAGELRIDEQLQLSHDQNMLSIELLKPDYVGLLNPEYQYRLSGLTDEWSKWTHANLIDYSYLPPGEYQLEVKVRDALGQIEEDTLLRFTVATPYWQQPWFYAVQALILALIIGITSRLDESKPFNRFMKHGLSILTLVVIIQFMQAVISAFLDIESTPVVDFLIDAGIALMIFPLEWVLRKLILDGGLKISGTTEATKL
ncbi:triple tyrosine motif-containing protein [Ekhidna sp. MALMAid0563]|uniref:triple tyrosine motif-containing protein n=1 Tax=Ekhidna sp. MALMAid0563 TaxID=3143937 RepID=UPI0032E0555A